MDSKVRINNVEVYVNGEKQTQASLDRCADKEGVGNGGCLLSIAMVEFVRSVAYGESVPELTVRNVLEDLDKLIDLAAGAAIRDLSVRAATLKRQLLGDLKESRSSDIKALLEDIVWLRGAAQFGEGDDLFSVIKSATEEMDRIDELAGDLWALMQEWIEVDRIEGAFSCDEVLHKFDSSSLLNGENNDQRPDGFITVPRAKSVHNMSESGI